MVSFFSFFFYLGHKGAQYTVAYSGALTVRALHRQIHGLVDLPCTFCNSHPAMLSYMMPNPFGPARTLQLPPWSSFSGSIQQHQQGRARAEPEFQGCNVATLVKIVVHCVVITHLVRALCCILLLKAPIASPKKMAQSTTCATNTLYKHIVWATEIICIPIKLA
jgi:hypothetical protein